MLEYTLLEFRPSTLAAAAVLLSDAIVATNEAFCKRDLSPFSHARWASSGSAASSTSCYLSFLSDPAPRVPSQGPPAPAADQQVALQPCISPTLLGHMRSILDGCLGRVSLAVAALAELHSKACDSDSEPVFLAVKDKYEKPYYMAVARECPLEGPASWPPGVLGYPVPQGGAAAPLGPLLQPSAGAA